MTGSQASALAAFLLSCSFAGAALPGCAPTNVTLRSNHYRVHVPSGWQVVEAGGDGVLPTLLRIPTAGSTPAMEVRLYSWTVQGPLDDPPGEAFKRLADGGVVATASASRAGADPARDTRCPDQIAQLFVFGRPARAIHADAIDGRRAVVTAGYAYGSLVGVVAVADTSPGQPPCLADPALHAIVKQLTDQLVPSGDASRPIVPPVMLEQPGTLSPVIVPPVDPSPTLFP